MQTGDDGLIETSDDASTLAKSALKQYLLSQRGARVMRPKWGASVEDLLFEPKDESSKEVFRVRAKEAQIYLRSVIVDFVEFVPSPSRPDRVTPVVHFHVYGDQDAQETIEFSNPTTVESGGTS